MKTTFFTPGPSQLYPGVKEWIRLALVKNIPSISHRSQAFMDIYAHAETQVRSLLKVPADYHLFFFSSATEIWERLTQNCISESSFHLVNGSFSGRFHDTALRYGKQAHKLEKSAGEGFDAAEIVVPDEAELIAFAANETSTGVWTPSATVEAIADAHPDKLIAVDGVSALPTWTADLSKIDALYFSVQKGFGLPAGLGVLILSPRMLTKALEMEHTGAQVGSYHRFSALADKAAKQQTPATPNVLNIYLLGQVATAMVAREDDLRVEAELKSDFLYSYFDTHRDLRLFVQRPEHRSKTLVVVEAPGEAPAIADYLRQNGYAVGLGYGKHKPHHLRIANFPATSVKDVHGLLETFERRKA